MKINDNGVKLIKLWAEKPSTPVFSSDCSEAYNEGLNDGTVMLAQALKDCLVEETTNG